MLKVLITLCKQTFFNFYFIWLFCFFNSLLSFFNIWNGSRSLKIDLEINVIIQVRGCLSAGEESNLTKLGNGGGKYNAQQKRQDYKSAKASPQSLEFTVKKPVPIVQEPRGERTTPKSASEEQQRTFQDLLDQKKVLDLLEVPSRFQNPNRRTAEEESEEKGACLSSPSSTDTLTDHSERGGAEEEGGGTPSPGPGGDTHVDHGGTRQTDDNRHQDEAKEHRVENDATTLTSAPEKHAESSPPGVSVGTEDARTAPLSLMPKTAPQNLDASYIDRRRPSKNAATFSSVATFMREKSEPQLMKIRKIDSFSEGGVCFWIDI